MKTVLVLATLVALALAGAVPQHQLYDNVRTKTVDAEFVLKQKKVFSLFQKWKQVDTSAEWYKIGSEYDIEANIEHYSNPKAIQEFTFLYRQGFMPKNYVFSIFYEKLREEAMALFNFFYYAKDFETFYKSAAWARVHLNEGLFIYTYYIAVVHREDLAGIVLPAPYETYPEYFVNKDVLNKMYRTKMQDGFFNPEWASQFGMVKENENYVFYANYSNFLVYDNDEQRLAYFTEDIGLNSYYYFYHVYFPFWLNSNKFDFVKERRGEVYFYFYQQLLSRYYLERLSNGLDEIPTFSWYEEISTGYNPNINSAYYPFMMRNNYYRLHSEKNYEAIRFLDSFEKTFVQALQNGQFAFNHQDIDLYNSKSINFVGNYWQANSDKYGSDYKNYQRSYEVTARQVLGAAPEPIDKYEFIPTALDFYQTSLRDPAFYQLYNRVVDYIFQYKKYLQPYSQDALNFVGVKINDVKVDKLVTYFDMYEYDATNALYQNVEEVKSSNIGYKVRQPRLNHKPFTVSIDVKSDVDTETVFKIFMGPKYNSHGYPISVEDNWRNFVELDWFSYKLVPGINKIERHSSEFFHFKEDSLPMSEIYKLLEQGKVPLEMSEEFELFPDRLMLPKGSKGGYPFQFFVVAYKADAVPKNTDVWRKFFSDSKPFGYPFDRPVKEAYFAQPNMFFEDVLVYHEGEMYPYMYTTPNHVSQKNEVPKH